MVLGCRVAPDPPTSALGGDSNEIPGWCALLPPPLLLLCCCCSCSMDGDGDVEDGATRGGSS